MDEEIKNEEQDVKTLDDDQLKEVIEERMRKLQRQNLLLGGQTVCKVILDKITAAMNQPGKRTMNDYKRLIKDVEKFCKVSLSRKVNTDGETEPVEKSTEETTQN